MGKKKSKKPEPLLKISFTRENYLTWCGLVFGTWFLFYPHPYLFLFTVNLGLPILGLILAIRKNIDLEALVNEDFEYEKGKKSNLETYFVVPTAAMAMQAINNDNYMVHSYLIFVPALLLFFVLGFALIKHHDLSRKNIVYSFKKHSYAWLIILVFSASAAKGINCNYDYFFENEYYMAEVIDRDKYTSPSGPRTYKLSFECENPTIGIRREEVTLKTYLHSYKGSKLIIVRHQGLLFVPWFEIEIPKIYTTQ